MSAACVRSQRQDTFTSENGQHKSGYTGLLLQEIHKIGAVVLANICCLGQVPLITDPPVQCWVDDSLLTLHCLMIKTMNSTNW